MYDDRKAQALETWHSLFSKPELRMTAQEQYEELLLLAEEYLKKGFINQDERKIMVAEATSQYTQAVRGVGEGT